MPAALEYIADASSQELRALEDAHAKEYDERSKRFARHWNYYDGEMHSPLTLQNDGMDDNILLPKVGEIADKTVSLLLGDGVQFDAGGDGNETEPDERIVELLKASRGEVLLHNVALDGAVTGQCWVRIEPREGMPARLVNLDPSLCSVFWDAFDVEKALWYRLQFSAGNAAKRIDYVKGVPAGEGGWNHEPDVWQEVVYTRAPLGMWKQVSIRPAWEYPFPPVVTWQNMPRPHVAYGADDIRRAIALNDSANFIASNWARVLKHFADPKTVGLGFDVEDLVPSSVGGLFVVNKPKSEADIYHLEMQSDMASSRELLAIVLREMWQSARMPDPQTVKDQVGTLTNFGLRVLYNDGLKKTETKRQLYEEGLVEMLRRAMIVSGMGAPAEINATWPDVLPEDAAEVSTALLKELEAQVIDVQTYRELRGYDHEIIEARLEEQNQGEDDLGTRLLDAFTRDGGMMRRERGGNAGSTRDRGVARGVAGQGGPLRRR